MVLSVGSRTASLNYGRLPVVKSNGCTTSATGYESIPWARVAHYYRTATISSELKLLTSSKLTTYRFISSIRLLPISEWMCAVCVRERVDFLHWNERKIYDFTAKMRCGTAQTNGLFAVVIQTEHIDNNNDDYNDSSTSLATLPTLPRNGSPYSTRPRLSLGPCQPAIGWIYYYYISWSLTHFTFLLGGTMLSMDSLLLAQLTSLQRDISCVWVRFLEAEKGSSPDPAT